MEQDGSTDGGDHRPEIVDRTGVSGRKKPQAAIVKRRIQKISQKPQKTQENDIMDVENCDFPDFSSDAQVCGQASCRDNGTDEQNLHPAPGTPPGDSGDAP